MKKPLNKWVIDPVKVEKLYKGGLIKEDTYKKMRGYADGGVVTAEPPKEAGLFLTPEAKGDFEARKAAALEEQASQPLGLLQDVPEEAAAVSAEPSPQDDPSVTLEKVSDAPSPMAAPQFDESPFQVSQAGIQMAANAGAEEAAKQAGYFAEMDKSLQDYQSRAQMLQDEQETRYREAEDKLRQSEVEFASQRIDSGRLFQNMSTGQKIAMGIGLMLSSVNGGETGTKIVQDAINRDLDAQKANLTVKRDNLNAQRGMLSKMLDRFGDERQALAASKTVALEAAKIRLDQLAANTRNAQVQGQLMQAKGEIALAAQKARSEFAQATRMSRGYQQGSELAQQISMLPKEVQAEAWNELGQVREIESGMKQVGKVMNEAFENTTIAGKIGGKLLAPQAESLREKAFADLFPIVKKIVGERMTDADARNLIEPYLPKVMDSKETIAKKKSGLMNALQMQVSGRAPRLSEFGLLPRMQFSEGKAK